MTGCEAATGEINRTPRRVIQLIGDDPGGREEAILKMLASEGKT